MLDCLEVIPRCVLEEEDHNLCKPISDEEIRNAVFSLGALKIPSGDGLDGLFFQNHWKDVGAEVCLAVKTFCSKGLIPDEVNETKVVRVPKCPRLEQVSEFCSINCCNFLYKIITRIIVLRMKKL